MYLCDRSQFHLQLRKAGLLGVAVGVDLCIKHCAGVFVGDSYLVYGTSHTQHGDICVAHLGKQSSL